MRFGAEVSEAEYLIAYLEYCLALSKDATRLSLFASESAKSDIASLQNADIAFFRMTNSEKARGAGNIEGWISQFDEAFSNIEVACHDVIMGRKLGLI